VGIVEGVGYETLAVEFAKFNTGNGTAKYFIE